MRFFFWYKGRTQLYLDSISGFQNLGRRILETFHDFRTYSNRIRNLGCRSDSVSLDSFLEPSTRTKTVLCPTYNGFVSLNADGMRFLVLRLDSVLLDADRIRFRDFLFQIGFSFLKFDSS